MQRSLLYTTHILEAIAFIDSDLAGRDFDSFRLDRRARQLVERNLEIISEASRRIDDKLQAMEPGINWLAVAGIGNGSSARLSPDLSSHLVGNLPKGFAALEGCDYSDPKIHRGPVNCRLL